MDEQTPAAPVAQHPDPVEAVLSSLEGLDDRPVAEHVAVFEHAHDSLRRVLAGDVTRG